MMKFSFNARIWNTRKERNHALPNFDLVFRFRYEFGFSPTILKFLSRQNALLSRADITWMASPNIKLTVISCIRHSASCILVPDLLPYEKHHAEIVWDLVGRYQWVGAQTVGPSILILSEEIWILCVHYAEQEKKTFLASQIIHTTVTSELLHFLISNFKIAISPGGDLEWW